ncbi:MAG TPA: 3TM-type holin [Modicisalibacter sp.]|nr:3TM-type holin [Modicisalibacter sp.]
MQWQDAIKEVAKYAPAVATALGGPGAGVIATGATSVITGLLGIENTPQALVAATQDPEKRAELIRINNEHRQELTRMAFEAKAKADAEETARLSEINATMRAELSTEGWFKSGWRPGLGWIFALSLGVLACVLASIMARDPTLVSDPEFTGMLAWLFVTMGAALGINVRDRSKDKRVAMTGEMPTSFMDAIRRR